jgi:hypothetical protein
MDSLIVIVFGLREASLRYARQTGQAWDLNYNTATKRGKRDQASRLFSQLARAALELG